jgi:hypothetical protein
MPQFVHKFASGKVKCTASFPESPDEVTERSVTWLGRPTKRHLKQYVQWMHHVNGTMASSYNVPLRQAYHVRKHRWEFWLYAPNCEPRCEGVSEFGPEMPYTDNSHMGVFNV